MITVTGRGMYWLMNKPMLLMLDDGDGEKALYRFTLSQGHGLINFIAGNKFDFTKDAVSGRFRMYEIKNERSFKDGIYLELSGGVGKWNCYILPTGLPDQNILEKDILVAQECITKTADKD